MRVSCRWNKAFARIGLPRATAPVRVGDHAIKYFAIFAAVLVIAIFEAGVCITLFAVICSFTFVDSAAESKICHVVSTLCSPPAVQPLFSGLQDPKLPSSFIFENVQDSPSVIHSALYMLPPPHLFLGYPL